MSVVSSGGTILRSQRNEVFLSVKQSGFDPDAFDWRTWDVESRTEIHATDVLLHMETEYYIQFDLAAEGQQLCRLSPGSGAIIETSIPGSWDLQMEYVRSWLTNLKREITAPDLWESLSTESSLSAAASDSLDANAPFTSEERKNVQSSLAEIRSLIISSQEMTDEAIAGIDRKMTYLLESAERLGRKDWLNVAFSVVVNIITAAAMPPEAARNILNVAGVVLGWVLGGSPFLPKQLH